MDKEYVPPLESSCHKMTFLLLYFDILNTLLARKEEGMYLSRKVYTESGFSLIRFFKVGRKVFLLAHAFPEVDRSNILSKDSFQKVDMPS